MPGRVELGEGGEGPGERGPEKEKEKYFSYFFSIFLLSREREEVARMEKKRKRKYNLKYGSKILIIIMTLFGGRGPKQSLKKL